MQTCAERCTATYEFLELVSLLLSVVLRVPIQAFTVHQFTWFSVRFFFSVKFSLVNVCSKSS
jgi:hypothetical protein